MKVVIRWEGEIHYRRSGRRKRNWGRWGSGGNFMWQRDKYLLQFSPSPVLETLGKKRATRNCILLLFLGRRARARASWVDFREGRMVAVGSFNLSLVSSNLSGSEVRKGRRKFFKEDHRHAAPFVPTESQVRDVDREIESVFFPCPGKWGAAAIGMSWRHLPPVRVWSIAR